MRKSAATDVPHLLFFPGDRVTDRFPIAVLPMCRLSDERQSD